jgi:hypothetical protein
MSDVHVEMQEDVLEEDPIALEKDSLIMGGAFI